MKGSVLDLAEDLDLTGDVSGERIGAHGTPRADSDFFSKDLGKEVGKAIDHRGLIEEIARAVDQGKCLHEATDSVEGAKLIPARGEEIQSHLSGDVLTGSNVEIFPESAGHDATIIKKRTVP